MARFPDAVRALFDRPSFVTLATVNPDGGPQTSVLWARLDGDDVLLSTVMGRRKEQNLRREPRVSLTVYSPDNPYDYVEVRGTATMTEQGGRELIDELSLAYTGAGYSGDGPDDVRVVVRITPTRLTGTLV